MEDDIRWLLADILDIDETAIPLDATRRTFGIWDSLSHLQLIAAIEQRFDVRLTMHEITDLDSIRALADRVSSG